MTSTPKPPTRDRPMTLQGSSLWVKAGLALVAADFVLSLPKWALGVILILALALKYATDRMRQRERDSEHPPSPQADRSDRLNDRGGHED